MFDMFLLVFFCIRGFPPFSFGMLFALLTLLPPIRRWNQSFMRKIATFIVLASYAIFVFQPLAAYVNVKLTISMSRRVSPQYIDELLNSFKADIEKELFIRFIRPRLESRPCYSGQISICEFTNTIETFASDGNVDRKQSMLEYVQELVFNLFWVWLGCLITVLLVSIRDSKNRLTQAVSAAESLPQGY
jgi:hypothetical protein